MSTIGTSRVSGRSDQPVDPPGPSTLAAILKMPVVRRNIAAYLASVNQQYGHVAMWKVREGRRVYLVNEPEYIQQILVTQGDNFEKDRMMEFIRDNLLGNGLLTSEGALHKRQRKMMSPVFRKKRIASYAETMQQYAERTSQSWQDGAEIDMDQEMMRLTLAVVARLLFDADVDADAADVGAALSDIMAMFPKLLGPLAPLRLRLPSPGRSRFFAARDRLFEIIEEMIQSRLAADEWGGDLLSMLLAAQDEDDGKGMSHKQVLEESLTLFLAGHETTANALTWTFYLLSQHPMAREKMLAEIDAVWSEELTAYERFQKLKYTRDVLAESIRLYPPAHSMGRRSKSEFKMGPYVVPANSMLVMSPYVMHRDPRFWDDPTRFWPERWPLREAQKQPRFSYFPFGGGSRICIGEAFAWMEGVLLLATLCRDWRAELVPGHPVDLLPQVTLRPRHCKAMTLHNRHR